MFAAYPPAGRDAFQDEGQREEAVGTEKRERRHEDAVFAFHPQAEAGAFSFNELDAHVSAISELAVITTPC